MKSANTLARGGVSAILQSYAADLSGWATGLGSRYAIAVVLMIVGAILVFAAAAVGIAALFHFLEVHYGLDTAYEAIGGGLAVLGAILILAGVIALKRKMPPLPRPRRQVEAAKRMVMGATAVRALSPDRVKSESVTQLLIGAAATVLAGWIVVSRLQGRRAQK
jgi:hypothetical protein